MLWTLWSYIFTGHSPNHVAASDALRLNCDSKNFGPKVDMPAMRVASVAPAKQRQRKVGFFRRSSTDLKDKREKGKIKGYHYVQMLNKCLP